MRTHGVSPTSIRSRILKELWSKPPQLSKLRFTHVDPFEDTESRPSFDSLAHTSRCFTHVDPFEDTERQPDL